MLRGPPVLLGDVGLCIDKKSIAHLVKGVNRLGHTLKRTKKLLDEKLLTSSSNTCGLLDD